MNLERITNFELDTLVFYVPEVALLYCKLSRSHPYEIINKFRIKN